eukprot:4652017-Prymnesium_polylepis.1
MRVPVSQRTETMCGADAALAIRTARLQHARYERSAVGAAGVCCDPGRGHGPQAGGAAVQEFSGEGAAH